MPKKRTFLVMRELYTLAVHKQNSHNAVETIHLCIQTMCLKKSQDTQEALKALGNSSEQNK